MKTYNNVVLINIHYVYRVGGLHRTRPIYIHYLHVLQGLIVSNILKFKRCRHPLLVDVFALLSKMKYFLLVLLNT